jgi:hypothetical protein
MFDRYLALEMAWAWYDGDAEALPALRDYADEHGEEFYLTLLLEYVTAVGKCRSVKA